MSTINVKITDTGWLLTKGDKTISIKDNGDGRLANGDELSSELAGSGFTQQDITLVANELNNPQQKTAGKAKGNIWGNINGFLGGLIGGMSSLFSLGGMFGFGGGFFGGQDSWAFNGCGGVGFNDMRVLNYGRNSDWSGDIGYTGSTQGAYGLFGGDMFAGMNGMFSGMNQGGLFPGNSNNGLNLRVNSNAGTRTNDNDDNNSNTGISDAAVTETSTSTETSTTIHGTNDGNTDKPDGKGRQDGTNGDGSTKSNDAEGADGASRKKSGPKFYTGDNNSAADGSDDAQNSNKRKSITD